MIFLLYQKHDGSSAKDKKVVEENGLVGCICIMVKEMDLNLFRNSKLVF